MSVVTNGERPKSFAVIPRDDGKFAVNFRKADNGNMTSRVVNTEAEADAVMDEALRAWESRDPDAAKARRMKGGGLIVNGQRIKDPPRIKLLDDGRYRVDYTTTGGSTSWRVFDTEADAAAFRQEQWAAFLRSGLPSAERALAAGLTVDPGPYEVTRYVPRTRQGKRKPKKASGVKAEPKAAVAVVAPAAPRATVAPYPALGSALHVAGIFLGSDGGVSLIVRADTGATWSVDVIGATSGSE